MIYLWVKSFHLLTVVTWMVAVFALPVVLMFLSDAQEDVAGRDRLHRLGRRMYWWGHNLFGIAIVFGVTLWQGWRVFPGALPNLVGPRYWIHAKLTLLLVLLGYFVWAGRALKGNIAGKPLPTPTTLRALNFVPAVLLLAVIFLVLAKPF